MKMHVRRVKKEWWIGKVEGDKAVFYASDYQQLHAKYHAWLNDRASQTYTASRRLSA